MKSSELAKIFSTLGEKTPEFAVARQGTRFPLPSRQDFQSAFDAIFDRRYFTNHGPLVQELDEQVAQYLGVKHAVCVTNETVALMVALASLDLRGSIIVPALARSSCMKALEWVGLRPVVCDIERESFCLDPDQVESLIDEETCAILASHTWGRVCKVEELEQIADLNKLKLVFEAFDAFGSKSAGSFVGGFGSLEVLSFRPYSLVNTLEGGCVTTDDDYLASRLRTARNFHATHSETHCPLRMNAKMTEAQAALGLLALQSLRSTLDVARAQWDMYCQELDGIDGLSIVNELPGTEHAFSNFIVEVDEERFGMNKDQLLSILRAENVMCELEVNYYECGATSSNPSELGLFRSQGEKLYKASIQLPLGCEMSKDDCRKVARLIGLIQGSAQELKGHLTS
ncbi:MAG: DegT/DnrJ/EryC1/StrS family aminotransferase [Bdellovibrionales bacterium]|nr:DegT/DnrJ/EryC1/StrS family aminotransferase [Bdellovibrionales bacterium]